MGAAADGSSLKSNEAGEVPRDLSKNAHLGARKGPVSGGGRGERDAGGRALTRAENGGRHYDSQKQRRGRREMTRLAAAEVWV